MDAGWSLYFRWPVSVNSDGTYVLLTRGPLQPLARMDNSVLPDVRAGAGLGFSLPGCRRFEIWDLTRPKHGEIMQRFSSETNRQFFGGGLKFEPSRTTITSRSFELVLFFLHVRGYRDPRKQGTHYKGRRARV